MSNKSKVLSLFAMSMALMGSSGSDNIGEDIDVVSGGRKSTKEEINRSKGLKPFSIQGRIYWAINLKNALRKANKEK